MGVTKWSSLFYAHFSQVVFPLSTKWSKVISGVFHLPLWPSALDHFFFPASTSFFTIVVEFGSVTHPARFRLDSQCRILLTVWLIGLLRLRAFHAGGLSGNHRVIDGVFHTSSPCYPLSSLPSRFHLSVPSFRLKDPKMRLLVMTPKEEAQWLVTVQTICFRSGREYQSGLIFVWSRALTKRHQAVSDS